MDFFNIEKIDHLLEWIAKSRRTLINEAEYVANTFWNHRDELLEEENSCGSPVLGCRVIDKNKSLRIQWFYWKFYKRYGKTMRTFTISRATSSGPSCWDRQYESASIDSS